eukprot:g4352.t1
MSPTVSSTDDIYNSSSVLKLKEKMQRIGLSIRPCQCQNQSGSVLDPAVQHGSRHLPGRHEAAATPRLMTES